MSWSPDNVLISTEELRAAQLHGRQQEPDPWMARVLHQTGESAAWYKALCAVELPERPVHVELLPGLPMLLTRQPGGVEVYNDFGRAATDFFRCLRVPDLHQQLTQLHWKCGGVDLDPTKLARLCRADETRMVRTYCWFRLALGLFQRRRADRGMWQNRPIAYEVFDHQDPWARDLYSMMTDIDPDLPGLHGRLMRVQFEENPWEKILQLYDGSDTLFWIDAQPGFLRAYGDGSSPAEFVRRLEQLQGSFTLLWWMPELPAPLRRWPHTSLDGTSLTLVTKVA